MNKMKLENISKYVSDKILWNLVDENNFISTDNMIPNKGGVIKSEYLPQKGYIYAYKKGDILLSNIRPYFKKVWLADKDGGCSSDILVLRPIKVTPEYLYAVLSQDRFFQYDMAGTKGSKMPRGDKKHIMNFPVLKLKNTIKIGYILQILNQKIELNNKINTELEAMAKTIYDYWFLQFEFPNEEGKPYKSSGGKMIWNEELKQEIPEGWQVKKIKDILDVITGKEDANFAKNDGKYPFFTCGTNVLKCDEYKFEGKMILIAGNGFFNVKYYEGKCNAYQRTYVLIPKNEKYIGCLFYSIMKRILGLQKKSNGSIVKFITKKDIENILIILPSNKRIISLLNKMLSNIEFYKKENQKLTSLRDFLLPLLMNGQVGFKD